MSGLQGFGQSRSGKALTIGAILLCAIAIIYAIHVYTSPSDAAALSSDRLFICSITGKSFRSKIKPGTQIPVLSPYSHQPTGYEAELCYWTADGKIKSQPTPVLLNRFANKPEPTFCPECGRLVVPQNPPPRQGSRPPPTEQEYMSFLKNRSAQRN